MDPQRTHSTRPPSESDVESAETISASEPNAARIVGELIPLVAHLHYVYGIAVALDLALRMQNADRDIDLANCLRYGVIRSTGRELRRAGNLIERLGGRLPESIT